MTTQTEPPLSEIEQHHYDTVVERMGVNRLLAEEQAAHGEEPLDDEQAPASEVIAGTETRDAIMRVAVLGALLDEVKAAHKTARAEAEALLEQQYKATGTSKTDALLPDGTKVGSISRRGGERAATVTDEDVFAAWVRDNFPSEFEIEMIPMRLETRVRPGFAAKVMAEATAAGTARYVDEQTGQVHDVPGVEIRPSRAASHQMTYSRTSKAQALTGRELVARAWRSGALAPNVLPALAHEGAAE
ncbi:hypothetical protein HOR43_gp43 [Streptomyces phage Ididsumtinwong]|uniref:Uncharacterized protein n=1 Tax=Streptomyces phage Ididsumtinwong TaxID=1920308 RepID=A0A1J0MC61_9CAUD|nr:hypothetical protein HOR43_gp43 [Streptomyces phage Ididsumtinwong]APD18514.1 hypothetical protein SEA_IDIDSUMTINWONG_39 [Streptomyces phage Ididsumtinwong]